MSWMYKNKADYTNTFCFLMGEYVQENIIYNDKNFINWKEEWKKRLKKNTKSFEESLKLMRSVNPLVIPRNHKVEEALEAANNDNLNKFKDLLKILEKPYENKEGIIQYQSASPKGNKKYKTFCGT